MRKLGEEWSIVKDIWRCLNDEPKVGCLVSGLLLALIGYIIGYRINNAIDKVANHRIYLIETPSQLFLNHHVDNIFKCQGKTYVLAEYSYQEIDLEKIPKNAIDCRGE